MLFFNEQSHFGIGQYHAHMIIERMPANINTQTDMEILFRMILPSKMRSLSKLKSFDIQRILYEDEDLRRLAIYLSKANDEGDIPLVAFNSII